MSATADASVVDEALDLGSDRRGRARGATIGGCRVAV
jgi:hypothetical protein